MNQISIEQFKSFSNQTIASWMIYLLYYDLRNKRLIQDLVICWKLPIRDFPSNLNGQVEVYDTPN